MPKNSLQNWYHNNQINYSEKERLNKIGVNDSDYYNLQDLKQILLCEEWAKSNSEIRNKLSGKIKKITFFNSEFNDSKPDASNYSCAIITDGNDNNWVIVYRPSYVNTIENDVFIKQLDISINEVENKLNGNHPIIVANLSKLGSFILSTMEENFILQKTLPYDARTNPDKYILPLDIVYRPINKNSDHYAIYIGNKQVAQLPGSFSSAKLDVWNNFCGDGSSSSSSFPLSSSSSSSAGEVRISLIHPKIPFKRKNTIIRHIANTINHGYGNCSCHNYSIGANNCEHFANNCVLGLNTSWQSLRLQGLGPVAIAGYIDPINPLCGTFSNLKKDFVNNFPLSLIMDQEMKMYASSRELDDLTTESDGKNTANPLINIMAGANAIQGGLLTPLKESGKTFHSETSSNHINELINQSGNNRSYTRSKYQIEQEKFQERIEICPKDWCRIS